MDHKIRRSLPPQDLERLVTLVDHQARPVKDLLPRNRRSPCHILIEVHLVDLEDKRRLIPKCKFQTWEMFWPT